MLTNQHLRLLRRGELQIFKCFDRQTSCGLRGALLTSRNGSVFGQYSRWFHARYPFEASVFPFTKHVSPSRRVPDNLSKLGFLSRLRRGNEKQISGGHADS